MTAYDFIVVKYLDFINLFNSIFDEISVCYFQPLFKDDFDKKMKIIEMFVFILID